MSSTIPENLEKRKQRLLDESIKISERLEYLEQKKQDLEYELKIITERITMAKARDKVLTERIRQYKDLENW